MFDLFTYPVRPGAKRQQTSFDAAKAMRPRAPLLREAALAAIVGAGARGMTPDEVAARTGATVLAVRPRVTELAALGMIRHENNRRPNVSGRSAIVWLAA